MMDYDQDVVLSPLMDSNQMVVMLLLWKDAQEISSQHHDMLMHVPRRPIVSFGSCKMILCLHALLAGICVVGFY